MMAGIGNTTFGTISGSPASIAHNNDGNVVVAFIAREGCWTASNFKYNNIAMAVVESIYANGCRMYAAVLENAPQGTHNLTFSNDGGTWYYAVYSITAATVVGNTAQSGVSQSYNIHCQVATRDTISMVVCCAYREQYPDNEMVANNMAEDDDRAIGDNRAAAGHVQGTGGTIDPYWNWGTTEDAVMVSIEIHGFKGGSQPIWIG